MKQTDDFRDLVDCTQAACEHAAHMNDGSDAVVDNHNVQECVACGNPGHAHDNVAPQSHRDTDHTRKAAAEAPLAFPEAPISAPGDDTAADAAGDNDKTIGIRRIDSGKNKLRDDQRFDQLAPILARSVQLPTAAFTLPSIASILGPGHLVDAHTALQSALEQRHPDQLAPILPGWDQQPQRASPLQGYLRPIEPVRSVDVQAAPALPHVHPRALPLVENMQFLELERPIDAQAAPQLPRQQHQYLDQEVDINDVWNRRVPASPLQGIVQRMAHMPLIDAQDAPHSPQEHQSPAREVDINESWNLRPRVAPPFQRTDQHNGAELHPFVAQPAPRTLDPVYDGSISAGWVTEREVSDIHYAARMASIRASDIAHNADMVLYRSQIGTLRHLHGSSTGLGEFEA